MPVHLSARLSALAQLVPQDSRIIDVGTDHGLLPVWLVQTGKICCALATDIRSGPLENAAELVERTGTADRITLKQTDGLQGIAPEQGDTVILAGMGGESMISILSAAPWTREGKLLILEPQSKKAELRRWLMESGYAIRSERLVEDAGHIYSILCVRGGNSPVYSEAELHLGLLDQIGEDPLFIKYLDVLRSRAAKAAPYNKAAAGLLKEYNAIKRRFCYAHCPGDI